jgi:hypothetical protein
MAALFNWGEANGAGQTLSSGIANVNWKNTDDTGTAYSSSPITAGNNSYEKWQFGIMYGTFNQISAGLFAHTAGVCGTGVTLFGPPVMAADGNKLTYTTPATASNAALTVDMSSVIAIGSGSAVWFGATSPTGTKTATSTANPTYTNYLTTQLRTTGSAAAGDIATITLTLRYDEN